MTGYWHPDYAKLPRAYRPINRPEAIAAELRGKYLTISRNLVNMGILAPKGNSYELRGGTYSGPQDQLDLIQSMLTDWSPTELWYRNRQVYAPDPYLTATLLDSGSSTIPGEALRKLPHPNPLFALSEGVHTPLADGTPGRIVGFHVTGARSFKYGYRNPNEPDYVPENASSSLIVDSHDEQANALHVCILAETFDAERTQVINGDVSHLTIPLVEDFTINSLADRIIADGYNFRDRPDEATDERLRTWLQTAIHTVVPHLLYTVSDKLEIDREQNDLPPAARRIPGEKKPLKPCRMHYMGAALGAAIRSWKYTQVSGEGRSWGGTGRTVRPHVRGAHFHTYKVGPGRQEKTVKFLLPFPVNAKADDGHTLSVRPVR